MKMKVVSLMHLKDDEARLIARYPEITFKFYSYKETIDEEDMATMDILIGYRAAIDEDFINRCPNLKWIAWFAAGVNALPCERIHEKGIKLTNAKGIQSKQIAEFVLTFLLMDAKCMYTSLENQREHVYHSRLTGRLLSDYNVLLLGTGSIATEIAKMCRYFGMQVSGVNTRGEAEELFEHVYTIDNMKTGLKEADVVINTLPETKSTIHLLTKAHFETMSSETHFINVGRGSIVKSDVLVAALKAGEIRHASLDVFEKEPLPPTHPLYSLDNVTLTAHISANEPNNIKKITRLFEQNLDSFLNSGEVTNNVVLAKQGY